MRKVCGYADWTCCTQPVVLLADRLNSLPRLLRLFDVGLFDLPDAARGQVFSKLAMDK
jgi:hypothetical protein